MPRSCSRVAFLALAAAAGRALALVHQLADRVELESGDGLALERRVYGLLDGLNRAVQAHSLIEDVLNSSAPASVSGEAKQLPCCGSVDAWASACRLCVQAAPTEQPLQLWRRQRYNGSHSAAACSVDDQVHMNASLLSLTELIMTHGLSMLPHALPQACGRFSSRGLNFTDYGLCLQELFELSAGCTHCHVKFLQRITGTDLFHLGCLAKCAPAAFGCQNHDFAKPPEKECLAGINTCLSCVTPPYKEILDCINVPTRTEGKMLTDNFVRFMRNGNISWPAFADFHRKNVLDFQRKTYIE